MYERFYGLSERPFELDPNPSYLFLTARHREALASILYGITVQRGSPRSSAMPAPERPR